MTEEEVNDRARYAFSRGWSDKAIADLLSWEVEAVKELRAKWEAA